MLNSALFTDDFKTSPFWWDTLPGLQESEAPLPSQADVVIIGSGFAGLNAALEIGRAGRKTVLIDSETLGWGASSRNGGQVSTSIKPSFSGLSARYGQAKAFAIRREGQHSLVWLKEFVAREGIDCELVTTGRFHGAHNTKRYDALAKDIANEPEGLETEAFMVPRAEQHREISTDVYHGGVVYPHHASINPAKLHRELLKRVGAAGVEFVPHCRALEVQRNDRGLLIRTSLGQIHSREAVIATNGYTGTVQPWLRRRVIPIGSYIIATEEIGQERVRELIPNNRTVGDTRSVIYYYRASPDQRRILFGGRVSLAETDPRASAPKLYAELCRLLPQMTGTKVSHSWLGLVGYTFDTLPHLGKHDGVHYVMGFCGSGVGMASYLGMRLGQQVIGLRSGVTAFDDRDFPSRPYYFGNPWFLNPAVFFYRQMDRLNR